MMSLDDRWRATTCPRSVTTPGGSSSSRSCSRSSIMLVFTLFNIWFERRVVARMQHRLGPNVHGPFGLLQSLADGVKLMLKEDLIPKAVDKAVYVVAPLISAIPPFMAVAVIPFGPDGAGPVHRHLHAAAADRPAGRGALRAGDRLRRHLRDRAGRLVVRVDVLAARSAPLVGPGHLLRGRDGTVLRRGVPLLRVPVDVGHRRRAAAPLVRRHPAAVVPHLPDRDGGRDQPGAVRPPRGRG